VEVREHKRNDHGICQFGTTVEHVMVRCH